MTSTLLSKVLAAPNIKVSALPLTACHTHAWQHLPLA